MTDNLEATHRSLCQHDYADITIQDIAAKSTKSKVTTLPRHGTKGPLISMSLNSLDDQYTAHIDVASGEPPLANLHSLLDILLWNPTSTPKQAFQTVTPEKTAQPSYDNAIQKQLTELDAYLFDRLQRVIEADIETRAFGDKLDSSIAADFLMTIKGTHSHQLTANQPLENLSDPMTSYTQTDSFAGDPAEAAV